MDKKIFAKTWTISNCPHEEATLKHLKKGISTLEKYIGKINGKSKNVHLSVNVWGTVNEPTIKICPLEESIKDISFRSEEDSPLRVACLETEPKYCLHLIYSGENEKINYRLYLDPSKTIIS